MSGELREGKMVSKGSLKMTRSLLGCSADLYRQGSVCAFG